MRRAAKRDAAEPEIVRTLRAYPGVVVQYDGSGRCDFFARLTRDPDGRWLHCEAKTGDAKPKPHQQEAIDRGETVLVRSAEDVLRRLGII